MVPRANNVPPSVGSRSRECAVETLPAAAIYWSLGASAPTEIPRAQKWKMPTEKSKVEDILFWDLQVEQLYKLLRLLNHINSDLELHCHPKQVGIPRNSSAQRSPLDSDSSAAVIFFWAMTVPCCIDLNHSEPRIHQPLVDEHNSIRRVSFLSAHCSSYFLYQDYLVGDCPELPTQQSPSDNVGKDFPMRLNRNSITYRNPIAPYRLKGCSCSTEWASLKMYTPTAIRGFKNSTFSHFSPPLCVSCSDTVSWTIFTQPRRALFCVTTIQPHPIPYGKIEAPVWHSI
jgi:hypothetical protein